MLKRRCRRKLIHLQKFLKQSAEEREQLMKK